MQETGISYSFRTNNTWLFFRLLVFCVLEFLVLVIIFFWWLVVAWDGGEFSLLLSLLVIALPIATFYLFRKKTTVEITVLLSRAEIEIQWPSKKMIIHYADIESYSACRTVQDTYDRESVRIRLKNGKKVRLTATSDLCDLKPLQDFRENFDKLAQNLNLKHKNTWEERLLQRK